MLKRTKGIFLLILLVVTGFAGRVSSDTISSQERRFLVDHLKDSKTYLLKAIKGLSEEQMNFKASPEKWSIKECIQHIALSEGGIWQMAEGALKQSANPEKRSEIKISDADLIKMVSGRTQKAQAPETLKPGQASWATASEALSAFKEKRATLIKYAKTTTDDMRNHVGQGGLGTLDAYQMVLLLSAHTRRHTDQILEVKSSPSFPK
ncbi:MAG TPA: DinB family protein [Chitinophagaceae bacterium]|nr:DinB family protein [Chitinophagaceae bacterium]